MAPKVPVLTLNNGQRMPSFALGTLFAKDAEIEAAVKDAIDAGYRHIDTAHIYQNEAPIGRAIRAKIEEGVIKREDIFVTTKLWCTYFTPDRVIDACKKSNEKLGLGYIDLYLMHTPVAFPWQAEDVFFPKNSDGTPATLDLDYLDVWRKMEELVDLKLVRSIGVSNFNSQQLERVIKNCRIKPVNLQVECSPQVTQHKLIDFCRTRGVVVTAYCPLGQHNREKRQPTFLYDDKVTEIARKYNKTPAQVVLRYCVSWLFLISKRIFLIK